MSTDSSFEDDSFKTRSFDRNDIESSSFDAQSEKSPEMLEREIDAQRSSIGNLVDALENKLSPGQLIDQALAFTKGNGGEFFTNLGNTIKANPVPTVLTSVGLLWLMMGQNRRPVPGSGHSMFDDLGERLSGMAESVSDTLGNAKAQVQDKVHQVQDSASRLKEKASHLTDSVSGKVSAAGQQVNMGTHDATDAMRRQTRNVQSGFNYMLKEQPLALAAIGIAIGAMAGAALPTTERENRLLGQASDTLTDKAKHMASEGYDKASEIGKEFVNDMKTSPTTSGNSSSTQGLG